MQHEITSFSSFWLALRAGFVLLLSVASPTPATAADQERQRGQFRQALDAAENGRPWKPLAADLVTYPLFPWLEQTALRRRLGKLSRAEVEDFVKRWPGSLPAEELRTAFLRELARRKQWNDYLALYRNNEARDLRCHLLVAKLATGRPIDADEELMPLWRTGAALPDACNPVLTWGRQHSTLDTSKVWERIDLAREAGNTAIINLLADWLPATDRTAAQRTAAALRNPATTLNQVATWPDDARHRTAVVAGLVKLARRNSGTADAMWPTLKKRFTFAEEEINRVLAALALYRATEFDTDAQQRLAALPITAQDDATREWRVRTALALTDWNAAFTALDALSDLQKTDAEWRYLRARVLAKLGRHAEANSLFVALAREANFFGFLAADWTDQPYAICPLTLATDPVAEKTLLTQHASLARALEWHALDKLPRARREWNFALTTLTPEQRRLAVDLAYREKWYDRAPFTLNKGDELKLYEQRFPLARETQVRRESQATGLDPAWTYAIIRAESAWVTDARSSADALGLMQLLHGTALRIAKADKIPYANPEDLFQPSTNIALGTRYLSRMAQKYNGAPWLASAAYNAGPAPVERWLAARGTLEPDFFIATIPYRETREYVARVLAFSVIYDWRMNGQALSLAARLPRVGQTYRAPDKSTRRKAVMCPIANIPETVNSHP